MTNEQFMKDQIAKISEDYQGIIASLQNENSQLKTEKAQLQDAMKKLEVDGRHIGAGFKPASSLQNGNIQAVSVKVMGDQAAELFVKARDLVKLRQDPNARIVLKKVGDKISISVERHKEP